MARQQYFSVCYRCEVALNSNIWSVKSILMQYLRERERGFSVLIVYYLALLSLHIYEGERRKNVLCCVGAVKRRLILRVLHCGAMSWHLHSNAVGTAMHLHKRSRSLFPLQPFYTLSLSKQNWVLKHELLIFKSYSAYKHWTSNVELINALSFNCACSSSSVPCQNGCCELKGLLTASAVLKPVGK